jgi:hypothetical protein
VKNRESLYPGRVKLTPVDAANGIYDLVRADQPQEPGTPLNKKLLDFAVAACGVTAGTATAYALDDEFGGFTLTDGAKVTLKLHVNSGNGATLNINSTGARPIISRYGDPISEGINAGTWLVATYNKSLDAFVLDGGHERIAGGSFVGDGTGISNITIPFSGTNGVYAQYGSITETSASPKKIVLPFEPFAVMIFANNSGLISTVYNGAPKTAYITGNVGTKNGGTVMGNGTFNTNTYYYVPCCKINGNVLELINGVNITPHQLHSGVTTTNITNVSLGGLDSGVSALGGFNSKGVKYSYIAL